MATEIDVVRSQQGAHGEGRVRLAGPAINTFSAQIVVALLSLVHIVIMARALGPAGRGTVVFLTTVAGLTGYISTISAHDGIANQAGTRPDDRRSLATNAAALGASFGAIGALVVFFGVRQAGFLSIDIDPLALVLAALAVPGFVLMTYFTSLVRADYGFTTANVALVSVAGWIFGADAILALSGQLTVRLAVGVWSIGQFVGCVPLAVYLWRRFGFGRPDLRLARASVAFGAKAHGAGMLTTGTYRLDQWLLGALAGAGSLGVYSVAVAWFEGLFLLPTACAVVARPSIVEAPAEEAGDRAEAAARLGLMGTVVAGVALAAAAPVLCVQVFGEEFADAAVQLRILVPGAIGIALVKVLGSSLTARGRPGLETAATLVGFVAALVLYLVLIPAFGATGAAIASTVAYLVAGVATVVIFVRTLGNGFGALVPTGADVRSLIDLTRIGK